MTNLIQIVYDNILTYDWNSSFSLLFLFLAILAVMRRWGLFLILMMVILLGIGGTNLIIMNSTNAHQIVTVPNAVYMIGGGILAIGTLFTYIKFTLS